MQAKSGSEFYWEKKKTSAFMVNQSKQEKMNQNMNIFFFLDIKPYVSVVVIINSFAVLRNQFKSEL